MTSATNSRHYYGLGMIPSASIAPGILRPYRTVLIRHEAPVSWRLGPDAADNYLDSGAFPQPATAQPLSILVSGGLER